MIYKIRMDEHGSTKVMTPWIDTVESLVRAAQEAAFSTNEMYIGVFGDSGEIKSDRFGWYTEDEDIAHTARALGFQVEAEEAGPGPLDPEVTQYRFAF